MIQKLVIASTLAWFSVSSALAGQIAIVDFQRAVTETDEGKAAQARIDGMYQTKKREIERMQVDLEQEIKDFQSRAMILQPDARAEAEQSLMMKQRQFEQTYMQYQQEMQQTYVTLLQDLDKKMRVVAVKVAKENDYDVVLDSAVIVYHGDEVVDMTDALVSRYNTANP